MSLSTWLSGMDTGCDIPVRKWVDGANSCTECGAGCIGCTEDVFPDYGKRGILNTSMQVLMRLINLSMLRPGILSSNLRMEV